MPSAVYQCVPNFSEGRRREVIHAIADAIQCVSGVRLIDYSADYDHNRCVMTFLGDAEGVRKAAVSAGQVAVSRIDMRQHSGVHPRVGAIDVLPVIPLRHTSRAEAVALSYRIGEDLAKTCTLPIYFYEWSAKPGHIAALPTLRKGGFEALQSAELIGDHAPDMGGSHAHPTGGITIVGARSPLVAYNINLLTSDVRVAKVIAKRIREARGHSPLWEGVRALGLLLESQKRVQVSMNLTEPEKTPLPSVFEAVREWAMEMGASVYESEIIGAIPLASLAGRPPETILWRAYRPTQILETWLG